MIAPTTQARGNPAAINQSISRIISLTNAGNLGAAGAPEKSISAYDLLVTAFQLRAALLVAGKAVTSQDGFVSKKGEVLRDSEAAKAFDCELAKAGHRFSLKDLTSAFEKVGSVHLCPVRAAALVDTIGVSQQPSLGNFAPRSSDGTVGLKHYTVCCEMMLRNLNLPSIRDWNAPDLGRRHGQFSFKKNVGYRFVHLDLAGGPTPEPTYSWGGDMIYVDRK